MICRLFLLLACCLAGCTNFIELREDLQEAKTQLGRISGTVVSKTCADCPTVLVVLDDPTSEKVHTYRVYERPGAFSMVTLGSSRYLFGFNDLNRDFQFQEGEPSGWLRLPDSFAAGSAIDKLELVLGENKAAAKPVFGNLFDLRGMTLGSIDVELGTRASLEDSRFDADKAEMGLWQPLSFMKEGYAGLYFLDEYDPAKTPVLFVHGINGSPRDFSSLIASLDRRQFQAWVFYYPSGINLAAMSDGLFGMLSELRHRYPFKAMHVVAHSMGGLVSRGYLKACTKNRNCSYLRSFTSLSSPFGGHAAAQSGVDYAPVVVPVWRSMAPDSAFLKELFAEPLPGGIPHNLLFGYRNNVLVGTTSGDGTITLASQLRSEAQVQASSQRGFDEDHLSILDAEAVHGHVNRLLRASQGKAVEAYALQ